MPRAKPHSATQATNTVLAALRLYVNEGQGDPMNRSNEIHKLAEDGGMNISMDDEGIEDLFDRIKSGDVRLVDRKGRDV